MKYMFLSVLCLLSACGGGSRTHIYMIGNRTTDPVLAAPPASYFVKAQAKNSTNIVTKVNE